MISFPKYLSQTQPLRVCLVGLGNAGVNLADRMTMSGGSGFETVAINSDQHSLATSVSPVKVSLGPLATRGLGAGGDPEIGMDAARESLREIEEALAAPDIVFLCAGLGGGTGSGAGGLVAEVAKQSGALLIAAVTTPFSFEGRRRNLQAEAALQEIRAHADAVIHFENDRMAELSAPKSGVTETFSACDELLCGCLSAITRLLSAPGPLGIGLPDLLSVLNTGTGRCLFGTGAATGDNRAHEALERALKSPLLDRGHLLDEAASLLVHLSGPPSLSFSEVSAIMQEIGRQGSEGTMLHLGVSTTPDKNAPVLVTILAKTEGTTISHEIPSVRPQRSQEPARHVPARLVSPEPEPILDLETEKEEEPAPEPPPPPAPPRQPKPERATATHSAKSHPSTKPPQEKIKQETLQFEPIARGRFEKIEPTIVEGEDLDVPTFLRLKKP